MCMCITCGPFSPNLEYLFNQHYLGPNRIGLESFKQYLKFESCGWKKIWLRETPLKIANQVSQRRLVIDKVNGCHSNQKKLFKA